MSATSLSAPRDIPVISLRKFAKTLGVDSRELHRLLRMDGVLIADGPDRNMPSEQHVTLGHMIVYDPRPELNRPYRYVGVTRKGDQWLRIRYARLQDSKL
jgi:phage antirepressor YoqD-like protein